MGKSLSLFSSTSRFFFVLSHRQRLTTKIVSDHAPMGVTTEDQWGGLHAGKNIYKLERGKRERKIPKHIRKVCLVSSHHSVLRVLPEQQQQQKKNSLIMKLDFKMLFILLRSSNWRNIYLKSELQWIYLWFGRYSTAWGSSAYVCNLTSAAVGCFTTCLLSKSIDRS